MHLKRTLLCATLSTSLWAQAPATDPAQKVVATVAGKDITAADVNKMLSTFDPQMIQTYQRNPQDMLSRYYLVVHLAEEAEKGKLLDKSPYKEQFESLKLQLLSNARVNEENNSFPIAAEAIDAYYKQHAAQYEQAKIKVIYIPYAGQVPTSSTDEAAAKELLRAAQAKRLEADARKLADDIVKQLRGGADFAKLAEQYSEDPSSKVSGGDFGVIKATSDYPSEFKGAVFAMKTGEISALRQPSAFYVVRVDEKGPQPVNEVREPIITVLRSEHMNQWMKETTATYQVVVKDPDFLNAAGTPASPLMIAPKQ